MKSLVLVAHPDDEIIWMGGLIIRHAQWEWHIVSLCRGDDPDRAPRFRKVMRELKIHGSMSDLDDSPVLLPLSARLTEIKSRLEAAVPHSFDLIFTHGRFGEYTRHIRHEQVHRAVFQMVESGGLSGQLILFAYDDCGGKCTPRPAADAQIVVSLNEYEYSEKLRLIREIYGFREGSFEFRAAGKVEAFRLPDTCCGEEVKRLQAVFSNS